MSSSRCSTSWRFRPGMAALCRRSHPREFRIEARPSSSKAPTGGTAAPAAVPEGGNVPHSIAAGWTCSRRCVPDQAHHLARTDRDVHVAQGQNSRLYLAPAAPQQLLEPVAGMLVGSRSACPDRGPRWRREASIDAGLLSRPIGKPRSQPLEQGRAQQRQRAARQAQRPDAPVGPDARQQHGTGLRHHRSQRIQPHPLLHPGWQGFEREEHGAQEHQCRHRHGRNDWCRVHRCPARSVPRPVPGRGAAAAARPAAAPVVTGNEPRPSQRSASSTSPAAPRCNSPAVTLAQGSISTGNTTFLTRCGCSSTSCGARLTHSAKSWTPPGPHKCARRKARSLSCGALQRTLKDMTEHQRVNRQHQQRRQQQPGRAQPGLSAGVRVPRGLPVGRSVRRGARATNVGRG